MMTQEYSCVLVQDEAQLNSECSTVTFPTVFQKLNEMRVHEVICDVFFKVGREEKCFVAHRLILAAASDVFYANFFGPLTSKDGYTKETSTFIPDVYPDAFELLLRYCYCVYSEVAVDLAVHALYAAEKYNVGKLKTACLKRLLNINLKDAVTILNQAVEYNESTIINKCLEVIDEKADEVVFSKSLRNCDISSLKLILGRRGFRPTNQLALFKEVLKFAEKQCKWKNLPYNMRNVKEILGNILSSPKLSMSFDDIAEVVKSGIVTKDEIDYMLCKQDGDFKTFMPCHPENIEPCLYSLRRATELVKVDWMDLSTALFFKIDRNICIYCVGVYSWCDDDKLQLDDVSLMFGKYGENTQKLKIRKLHSESNITYIHIQDGLEVKAHIKYYFCVNIAGSEGRQFYYSKEHVCSSKLTTYDGTTLTLTCDDRNGNGFYPEVRFSF